MQGKVKRLSLLMAAIIVTGCAQTITPSTSDVQNKHSFSIKMTKEEIFRQQLEKWIDQGKGKQLVDELEKALKKDPSLFTSVICSDPVLLAQILAFPEVQQAMIDNPALAAKLACTPTPSPSVTVSPTATPVPTPTPTVVPTPTPEPTATPTPVPTSTPTPVLYSCNRITFNSYRDGNSEIYVMNSDGSNQINVSNDPGLDSNPEWAPDCSKIVFSSNRNGNNEIYTVNPDGSNLTKLTSSSYYNSWPIYSPDGTKIAFIRSNINYGSDLFVMNADVLNVNYFYLSTTIKNAY